MKWLTLVGILLYLSRHSEAGALKCTPESQEPSCASEKRDTSPVQSLIERKKKTESADAECQAGSEWESNCHKCRCSDLGIAQCLKQDSCDGQVFNEPIKCKPYSTFKKDCNTCSCLPDGRGLCTLIGCPPSDRRKREMRCQPGSTWKSSCNTCRCLANGVHTCTKMGCISDPSRVQKICSPGSKWNNGCNSCHCTSEGQPMCTQSNCNIESSNLDKRDTSTSNATLTRRTRAVQEAPKTCQPGTEFRMDCNKCLCNNEGQDFSCTRIDCAALNNNGGGESFVGARSKRDTSRQVSMQCVPGSVFDLDCNVCRCTTDGLHATCTLKRCRQETTEVDTESSFRCAPGDQFKRNCNDCTCSADGKNVYCTLNICDEDLSVI